MPFDTLGRKKPRNRVARVAWYESLIYLSSYCHGSTHKKWVCRPADCPRVDPGEDRRPLTAGMSSDRSRECAEIEARPLGYPLRR